MITIKFILALFGIAIFWYFIFWCLLGAISGALLSLGDPQRIVFIDKQLAKDVDKLHSDYQCMMSYEILTRFMMYCFKYPFIRYRVKTNSWKFRLFMWLNCVGFWFFLIGLCFALLANVLEIIV
ncbi:hypothetical protein [Vibrio metschnikovii]|uniref:hypothetical protein n=1 Tax=Vibrio metschnikovii TaxID=28172 RepID=UPI001C301E37|nr:hypothetical protein [Vibrio metschnikovii]